MTAVRPGRPRSEAVDAAIRDAAVALVIEHGAGGVTMEAVAERAGVAKTTVYRRWPDARDLVFEALRSVKDEPSEPPSGPVRDQLVWLCERMRRAWHDERYGAIMRRVVADGVTRPDLYRDTRDRLIAPHVEIMHGVLRRGVAEGAIRADVDLEWLRVMLVSPISASVLMLRPPVTRAEVEFSVDTVLRGAAPS